MNLHFRITKPVCFQLHHRGTFWDSLDSPEEGFEPPPPSLQDGALPNYATGAHAINALGKDLNLHLHRVRMACFHCTTGAHVINALGKDLNPQPAI